MEIPRPLLALLATTSVVAVSGLALGQDAVTSPAKPVKACAKKQGGTLRIAKKCRRTERRVRWGRIGPAGAQGVTGATGPQGPAGPQGDTGAAGAGGAAGSDGADGTTTGETFYAEALGAGTNFGGGACGGPAGPSITFTAPAGAYVQLMAQATMQRTGGTANGVCLTIDGSTTTILTSTNLATETRYLEQGDGAGTTVALEARPYVFPVAAGSHTISLSYSSTGGASQFTNRKLWVTMFRPTA
jgi:hypothetical protein